VISRLISDLKKSPVRTQGFYTGDIFENRKRVGYLTKTPQLCVRRIFSLWAQSEGWKSHLRASGYYRTGWVADQVTSHVAEVAGIYLAVVSRIFGVLIHVYARRVPTINTARVEADFVTKELLRDHASDDRTGDSAQRAIRVIQVTSTHPSYENLPQRNSGSTSRLGRICEHQARRGAVGRGKSCCARAAHG